jgi:hypothetical protein
MAFDGEIEHSIIIASLFKSLRFLGFHMPWHWKQSYRWRIRGSAMESVNSSTSIVKSESVGRWLPKSSSW